MSPQDQRIATTLYLLGAIRRTHEISAQAAAFLQFAVAELAEPTEIGTGDPREPTERELSALFHYALPEVRMLSPSAGAALNGAIAVLRGDFEDVKSPPRHSRRDGLG